MTGETAGINRPGGISVVAEDLAGMRSQAFGLAGYFDLSSDFCPVRPHGLTGKLPFRLWPDPIKMMTGDRPPPGNLVFSVAGKGGAVGAALRRRGYPVVQIQNPRVSPRRFDLVVASCHDEISGPNVLLSRTALHGLTRQRLEAARGDWTDRLKPSGRPLISVLAGGANGRFRFGRAEAMELAEGLMTAVRRLNASLFITTSRRTGEEATAILREAATVSGGRIWTGGAGNPYAGLIACSDFLVVTSDSVSMVSEAVAGSAPVYVYELPGRSRRISLFLETLQDAGRIRPFEHDLEPWPVTPLDDTPRIAREVSEHLGLTDLCSAQP